MTIYMYMRCILIDTATKGRVAKVSAAYIYIYIYIYRVLLELYRVATNLENSGNLKNCQNSGKTQRNLNFC